MMKRLCAFLFVVLFAATLLAERAPVVKPRATAHEYPAVKEQSTFTLGAAQLSSKQVRKAFVSNIGKDYVVVEVAIYPKGDAKVVPQDFGLRKADEKAAIHPADPQLMASQINEKDQKGTDVAIYPVTGITYTTGSVSDDPYYNNGRGRGLTTTSGVMVEMSGKEKDPKTSDADHKAMVAELSEKSLPAVTTAKPVAGYLYFPAKLEKGTRYQLEYQTPDGPVSISLPIPAE
jgi:hypothetical protein